MAPVEAAANGGVDAVAGGAVAVDATDERAVCGNLFRSPVYELSLIGVISNFWNSCLAGGIVERACQLANHVYSRVYCNAQALPKGKDLGNEKYLARQGPCLLPGAGDTTGAAADRGSRVWRRGRVGQGGIPLPRV